MKILSADQIRGLDAYTIIKEPISSIQLMERASTVFVKWFMEMFPLKNKKIAVFCGIGNNGGDGLAIARLLYAEFYDVDVYLVLISEKTSDEYKYNLERLANYKGVNIYQISKGDSFPHIKQDDYVIIDAIFGSGLNRAVEGYWGELLEAINALDCTKVAVDIPSGIFADRHSEEHCYHADYTLSFELPKLAFLFAENAQAVGEWTYRSIQLNQGFIGKVKTNNFYIDQKLIKSIYKKRSKFAHKGHYGHALLIMGSYGMAGAASLAAEACLRTGAALATIHAPKAIYQILQITIPEAMISIDEEEKHFSNMTNTDGYSAIGIGCGLGKHPVTKEALSHFLTNTTLAPVIDADALNIISENKSLLQSIPKKSILTPHPKEFERLFGKTKNDFERNDLQRNKAKELGVYILLKGAHSCIATPEGDCYFNSTGNPGMATAGSGDVLTGMIVGLLAQKYSAFEAVILGVYLHGLAGDIAAKTASSQEAMLASDIIFSIGKAYGNISQLSK